MKNKYLFYLTLIFFSVTIFNSNAQTTIWSENFNNTAIEDQGSIGTGSSTPPTTDTSMVDWNVDISSAVLSANTDWFKVTNQLFEARDIDGNAIWISPSIDINNYTNVNFSLSAVESGDMESNDVFHTEYSIDGGTNWVTATTNGNLNDDFNSATVSENNLNATTLQIRVTMNNNSGSEYHRLDDVVVTGTFNSSSPTVTFNTPSSSENETDSSFNTLIPVTFSSYTSDVAISVSIDGSSTAEAGDYTLNTNSLTFTGNETKNISLDINDDADINNETIILNIAVTTGSADINTSQHIITVIDDDIPIVINEILADPDTVNGDANGDGTSNFSTDEFVEIYNISGTNLDISGWILADASSDRHTFPNGTIIATNESIVVFGGGTPTTVPGLVQVASTNSLGLSNSGDTVTIKDNNGNTIVSQTYGSEAGNNQSIARNDDFTGTFVQHSTIISNTVSFSPGRDNTSNTPFSSSVKWTGITNNDWNTTTNWLGGTVPTSGANVIIPAGLTNNPTISSALTVNSITIDSGASLIANATVTGDVTYKRNLSTTNWYLVSSPVNGETIEDIINNHTLASGTGSNLGLAPFSNDGANAWLYQTSSSSGSLNSGQGYSIKLASSGDVSFTGTIQSSNVTTAVTTGGSRNDFNLVGNPFTSFINSDTFLTENASPTLSEATIWIWDGTQYVTHNNTNPIEIAPTQGFFVEAGSNGDVTFTTANQSHQGSDTFMRTTPKPNFELFINDGINKRATNVFYVDGKTTGFDNGYDSKMFSGVNTDFAIYTELLSNNEGKKLAIQTLPNSNFETLVIPVGIIANAGKEIEFSTTEINLPNEVNIILEDRLNGTFTDLSENNYKITLTENTNGVGRFYIHSNSQSLSNNNSHIENISIYKSALNTITITGLQSNKASLNVYSLLGKKVMQKRFSSNGVSKITIPSLATGMYIFEVTSEVGKIAKKIILE